MMLTNGHERDKIAPFASLKKLIGYGSWSVAGQLM
jgi:hypothetical protein